MFTYKYTPELQNKSSKIYKQTERNFTATVSKKKLFNHILTSKMRSMERDTLGVVGRAGCLPRRQYICKDIILKWKLSILDV